MTQQTAIQAKVAETGVPVAGFSGADILGRHARLAACHAKLDAAVAAAFGRPADLPEEDIPA